MRKIKYDHIYIYIYMIIYIEPYIYINYHILVKYGTLLNKINIKYISNTCSYLQNI